MLGILGELVWEFRLVILIELRKEHKKGNKYAGINVFTGKVSDMKKENVIEPIRVGSQAISSAADAAVMILRIDDVIAARAGEGGGKGPGKGGEGGEGGGGGDAGPGPRTSLRGRGRASRRARCHRSRRGAGPDLRHARTPWRVEGDPRGHLDQHSPDGPRAHSRRPRLPSGDRTRAPRRTGGRHGDVPERRARCEPPAPARAPGARAEGRVGWRKRLPPCSAKAGPRSSPPRRRRAATRSRSCAGRTRSCSRGSSTSRRSSRTTASGPSETRRRS